MRGNDLRVRRPHAAGALQRGMWMMVLIWIAAATAFAGTTGKLAGRVTDRAKQPLPGANIILVGTQLGAVSDMEGYYTILNIPPGRYQVRYAFIGYKTMTVSQILVTTDHTTTQDVQLEQSVIEGETVQVVAQRPIVETNLTSSVATVTSDAIAIMPVQDLQEVVDLQAGVVDGHFRGGRTGEVQYQINGVSVNNSYDNSSTLRIDRSLLQEVQVISGTFDAEYGQAMSGVVNVVLKSGTDQFAVSGEAYTSDYLYTSGDRRNAPDKFRPLSIQNYQASLSGPLPLLPRTYFIFSGRRYANDGYVYGERRFLPTDRANFENKIYTPGGDNKEFPLDTSREWSGLAKLTNRSLKNLTLEYQAIANQIAGKRYNYGMRFNPDGRAEQQTFSIVHGIDLNHTLSPKTFYNISLRQNYFNYTDYAFEDFYDARYDSAGPSMGDSNYEDGASIQGVELGRFKQQTNTLVLKGALTSQVSRSHQLKFGIELQKSELKFGSPGYLVNTGGTLLVRHIDEPPDYPGIAVYNPVAMVAYGQDQIEWRDLVVRAGARLEYFDARSTLPSDLANPANTIAGAPLSVAKDTEAKISLSPRLGISYPVTTSASLFFAYGHFYQMPALGQIFSNSDYAILDDLQAGGISYGVLGNPDIKPERTVQYEFGYKQAIGSLLGLDVSIFYKDIRDLLGVEFVSTYAAAEYARLTNIDFGNVLGYTIALDQ
ncbi:MAG TPA: TonB-dependent receptor, partial [bacterium]|nr:TonB-dependent receptor [bacterium]